MNSPSYEVGQLAALAVRLALSSGLSCEEARAAFGLASRMIDEETGAQAEAGGGSPALAAARGQRAQSSHEAAPRNRN